MKQVTDNLLHDLSGICLPELGATSHERLKFLSVFKLREKILHLFSNAIQNSSSSTEQYFENCLNLVKSMSAIDFVTTFDHPYAYNILLKDLSEDPLQKSFSLLPFLADSPVPLNSTFVFPPQSSGSNNVYLPHVHLLLVGNHESIGASNQDTILRATWNDGFSLTIPKTGIDKNSHQVSRIYKGHKVGQWRVLNGMNEVNHCPEKIESHHPSSDELNNLQKGLQLLHEVWPEAYFANTALVNKILILAKPGSFSNSWTSPYFQGAICTSVHSPIQVGDAICHESSHSRIHLLMEIDPLLIDDGEKIHVSPWRKDLRPLRGILLGVHAFINVCMYYHLLNVHRPSNHHKEIFNKHFTEVVTGCSYLEKNATWTRVGNSIMDEMSLIVSQLEKYYQKMN